MKISCVTASYVADLLRYPGEIDWDLASATIEQAPMLETLDGILDRLVPAGLDGIEFWFPHVSPKRLTPVMASEIARRLDERGLVCCACAGGIGDPVKDPYGCMSFFQTARLLGAPLIAGHLESATLPQLGELCARYGVKAAFENATEKDVGEILSAIQGGSAWIGANIDTGNMAVQGGDPVAAIRELGDRIMHVHLKDVSAVGDGECVAPGEGIVDVPGVLRELGSCGYDGWLSIEIETSDHDPTDEIIASAETVRSLLGIRTG
jgi:sugar phosphate isomerase/epimerase